MVFIPIIDTHYSNCNHTLIDLLYGINSLVWLNVRMCYIRATTMVQFTCLSAHYCFGSSITSKITNYYCRMSNFTRAIFIYLYCIFKFLFLHEKTYLANEFVFTIPRRVFLPSLSKASCIANIVSFSSSESFLNIFFKSFSFCKGKGPVSIMGYSSMINSP